MNMRKFLIGEDEWHVEKEDCLDGVAAIRLGCHFLGIDLSEEFV